MSNEHAEFWMVVGAAAPALGIGIAYFFGKLTDENTPGWRVSDWRAAFAAGENRQDRIFRIVLWAELGLRAAWFADTAALILALIYFATQSDFGGGWLPWIGIGLLGLSSTALLIFSGATNKIRLLRSR